MELKHKTAASLEQFRKEAAQRYSRPWIQLKRIFKKGVQWYTDRVNLPKIPSHENWHEMGPDSSDFDDFCKGLRVERPLCVCVGGFRIWS